MIVDALRWMDTLVVNPVATRLAGSVANPAVLSYLLWDRLKTLTPQRARDLMRLLTTAMANAAGVFGAEKGQQCREKSKQLQKDFVHAASTRNGRDVVLNSVATVAKVAQALNTPETKAATQQLLQTLQSVVDFFASDDGRRIVSSSGQCLSSVTEMAASPEASIFLAELATNLLHTLESEERRHYSSTEKKDVKVKKEDERDERQQEMEQDHKHSYSPTSSTTDSRWSVDTESMLSSAPGAPMTGTDMARTPVEGHTPSLSTVEPKTRCRVSISSPAEKSRSYRSARIEKEVLLRLGVDPSMLSEIQRVLDVIAADEEEKERVEMKRRREEAEYVAGLVVSDSSGTDIAPAFGNDMNDEKPDHVADEDEDASLPPSELLPKWHEEPLREALRRRYASTESAMEQRDSAHRQAREMAVVLAQRNIKHGNLQPGDIVACRTIARMIVYGTGFSLLLSGYLLSRKLFG